MIDIAPKVFISYSHDNPTHIDKVWQFSNKLRAEGIDCILDQYEESPKEGWPRWMDKNIKSSDFVIMICTKIYKDRVMGEEKAGNGHGVIWEGNLIYQYLYDAGTINSKFIPVIFEDGSKDYIPTPLKGATFYFVEKDFEMLYRRLRGITKQKPELGKLRAILPEKERKTIFTALHFDAMNTSFCTYIDEKNSLNGHVSIIFYGIHIANISESPFTIKDVKIQYSYDGHMYSEISNVIFTSKIYFEQRDEYDNCITLNVNSRTIVLIGWNNLRSVIGENKLILPGGILVGSALFILNFKNFDNIKKITDFKMLITDYSNNESLHPIEIKDNWIEMGRVTSISPKLFKVDSSGKAVFI